MTTEIDSLECALSCAKAALDKKAENLVVLDLRGISSFTDYFVICNAMSDRQIQTIADSVSEKAKKEFGINSSLEGYTEGRWVLIDCGDVVVHVFLDAIREYYDLETIWSRAKKVQLPDSFFEPAASTISSTEESSTRH